MSEDGEYTILKRKYIDRGCRIEVLECEVAMWRKHVPELEKQIQEIEKVSNFNADRVAELLAKAKLSNKGMHKTIERMTYRNGVECVHGRFLHEHCDLCEGEAK